MTVSKLYDTFDNGGIQGPDLGTSGPGRIR